MCRPLAHLIDNDISIQYKIELARAGRIDGTSSVATVTVADRLTSLREHRARFRAGDHPLKRLQGEPFGSRSAFSSRGFVTTISEGVVNLWRPPAAFAGIAELRISHSIQELGLAGFDTGSCVADVRQDLLVFSGKTPNSVLVQFFRCCSTHVDIHLSSLQTSRLFHILTRQRRPTSRRSSKPDFFEHQV